MPEWFADAGVRLSSGSLRRRFMHEVVTQYDVMPSRHRQAYERMEARVSPRDVGRLVHDGDLTRLGIDAAEVYLRTAQEEGWKITGTPAIVIVVDELIRPGSVRVRPLASHEAFQKLCARARNAGPTAPPPAPRRTGSEAGSKQAPRPGVLPRPDGGAGGEAGRDVLVDEATAARMRAARSTLPLPAPDASDGVPPTLPQRLDLTLRDRRSGGVHRVTKTAVTLGRSADCDLVFDSDHVSRRHAEIYRQEDAWWIRDTDSRNGTLLDDTVVKDAVVKGAGPHVLRSGATIWLGGKDGVRLEVGDV